MSLVLPLKNEKDLPIPIIIMGVVSGNVVHQTALGKEGRVYSWQNIKNGLEVYTNALMRLGLLH